MRIGYPTVLNESTSASARVLQLEEEVALLRAQLRTCPDSALLRSLPAALILDSITDGFIAVDHNWRITYVNPEAARINKKPMEVFLGRILWDEWPAAAGTELERQYRAAVSERRSVHFEHRYIAPGYDVWLEVHAYPFPNGLAILYRDISERKASEQRELQLQERLQHKVEEFETLFRSISAGIAISEDPACKVVRVNPALAAILGMAPEENASKSGPDAPRLPFRLFRGDDELSSDELPLQTAQREGRSIENRELHVVRADGEVRYMYGSAVPLFDSAGAVRGGIAAYVDTTDRKQAEEKLRTSERIYRAIGESIPFGAWICDPSGRNVYASDSTLDLMGISQQQCSEFGWLDSVHVEDRERVRLAWQECVRTEGNWDIEFRFLDVHGGAHPVLVRGTAIRDDEGRIACWAGMNLDIAQVKAAEAEVRLKAAELERVNRQLEGFVYIVSHDLQEPLRTVSSFAELLLRKVPESPETRKLGAFVTEAVQRMEALIRDLLDLSRLVHGVAPATATNTDAAFDEALLLCNAVVQETDVQIFRDRLPVVLANHGHIVRVFQNLISNAIKYRRLDRALQLRVSASVNEEECVISFADNGIGFAPEHCESIFGLFTRLHGREYSGTGIGLTICRRILERYGGSIQAESEAGRGATFVMRIPLAKEPIPPQ